MVENNRPGATVDLAGLEQAAAALIERCDRLHHENAALRLQLAQLTAEREAVDRAKKLARDRVAAVVQKLKALEK